MGNQVKTQKGHTTSYNMTLCQKREVGKLSKSVKLDDISNQKICQVANFYQFNHAFTRRSVTRSYY